MITKTQILAKVDPGIIASKNEAAIAEAFSLGRTKLVDKRIGIGTIIETLGITSGNAFLDAIFAHPDFRYVKLLIERGDLNVGSTLVQSTIDSMVPAVLTAQEAANLKSLGIVPDPVSSYDIAAAFERNE